MRTALTMYNNMQKRGYNPGLNKEDCLILFKKLVSILEPDEEVILPFIAKYDNKWQPCALTEHRILIITRGPSFFNSHIYYSTIGLAKLKGISTDDPKATTSLHFKTEDSIHTVEVKNDLVHSLARAIYNEVETTIEKYNNKNIKKGNVSVSKEIERFKKLLDNGVITQAEFEQAKTKLLQ